MSEQEFAASLEADIEKPTFVLNEAEGPTVGERISGSSPQLESCSNSRGDSRPRLSGQVELDNLIVEQTQPNLPVDSITPDWRDQVSAKVNKYKSSKAPKVRYPSLQLQFDPPAPRRRWQIEPDLPAEPAARDLEIPQARQVPQAFVSLGATARIL